VKIQGFAEPPRLDPELKHEPNSTLTPELLIYYIGESRPNPPGVSWSLNERYELGFQGCSREGGRGCYILAGTSILDPPIKPTWKNSVDAIEEAVENRHSKEGLTGGAHMPSGPTWQPPALRFGGLPPVVFWNLLELFSLWISVINSDVWVHLDGFLDKPCWKHRFTKTCGIC